MDLIKDISEKIYKKARLIDEDFEMSKKRHLVIIGGQALSFYGIRESNSDFDFISTNNTLIKAAKLVSVENDIDIDVGKDPVDFNCNLKLPEDIAIFVEPVNPVDEKCYCRVMSLPALLIFKSETGREKDIDDVQMILRHVSRNGNMLDFISDVKNVLEKVIDANYSNEEIIYDVADKLFGEIEIYNLTKDSDMSYFDLSELVEAISNDFPRLGELLSSRFEIVNTVGVALTP